MPSAARTTTGGAPYACLPATRDGLAPRTRPLPYRSKRAGVPPALAFAALRTPMNAPAGTNDPGSRGDPEVEG